MPKYNPNSIWASKKKEDLYTPSSKGATTPKAKPPVKPPVEYGDDEVGPPPERLKSEPVQKPVQKTETFFKKPPVGHFDEEPEPKKNYTLLLSIIGGIILVGIGALYFLLRPATGPNVGLAFSESSTQALTGAPFTFTVTVSNYSQSVLTNATLSVLLPNTISFAGQAAGTSVQEQTLGDVGAGQITPEPFTLIVTGGQNSVQNIVVKLTYGTADSKAQFETDGNANVVVGGPAISLNIGTPQSVFSGQAFNTVLTYTNNTGQSFDDVELALQYPPVFSYTGSTAQPDSPANDSWNLGTIPPSGTGSITLTGSVIGTQGSGYAFAGNLTGQVMGDTYTLTNQTGNFTLANSPLALTVSLNNASDSIAHTGDNLSYTISYTNNSSVTFQNLSLKAALVGAMFDFSSLESQGSFNSINDTVTWNGANTPALLNLAPGQSGSVSFTINAKSAFPIRLMSDKDYTLTVNAVIASPTVPPGTAASSTTSAANTVNKIGGELTLASKGYWRDAASGVLNSGPYPPVVNAATEYTIHWILTNYSTDATNITVSAYLQSGTTCTGTIKSNISTSPVCNSANGLITWTIPTLPATTGITGPAAQAIIQVTNTPAVNQVGSAVTLLGQTTLQGTDAFTGEPFSATAPAITTNLPDDTTISPSQSRYVTQ